MQCPFPHSLEKINERNPYPRPKEDAIKILKNVRAAMGSAKATLLIGECALPNHDVVGVPPVMYQIDMQVCPFASSMMQVSVSAHDLSSCLQMMAIFGTAMERTPEQWKALLAEAGFEMVALHPTRSLLHWVEAKPI